jgi:glycosyltransferase involved in cell wall biosynthesis
MESIGVVHMDLMAKGGGESVCMNVLEALQDDYDVHLLTLTEPDFEELNDYFNTAVRDVSVELAGWGLPAVHEHAGLRYYILQNALLSRYARQQADEYDQLISTINELGLPGEAIEYVHFPFDWNVNLDGSIRDHIFHPTVEEGGVYERLCSTVAGITVESVQRGHLLANSEWTADAVEHAYGTRPAVVHPPIDTSEFIDYPWQERESGFVCVGRIERSKRIHELIGIVDGVRERGHDVHLHVVGPTVDSDYSTEIANMAARRPYVHLEGEVPRSELVELICTHRYGIHGKRYEHFGMAVAELVAGGTVTFVPDSGGQSGIVENQPEQVYTSPESAVDNICQVLSSPELQASLRSDPADIRERFGRERFQEEIASLVRTALGKPEPRRPEPIA